MAATTGVNTTEIYTKTAAEVDEATRLAWRVAQLSDASWRRFMAQYEQMALERARADQGLSAVNPVAGIAMTAPALKRSAQPPCGLPWPQETEQITLDTIDAVMTYQPWDEAQRSASVVVTEALTLAAKAILRHVQDSPHRGVALRNILDALMNANAAISFRGRF